MYFFPVAVVASLLAAEQDRYWKSIPVCDANGIVVRLKVLGQASLGTRDWLAIEIDNLGKPPRKVKSVSFDCSTAAEEFVTGKGLFTGSLMFGQRFDSERTKLFTSGRYRDMRDASDSSAASLGLPGAGPLRTPAEGYRVRARFHIRVEYEGGKVETPREGVPFDFEWHRPSEAGFASMRERLRDLLANPVNKASAGHSSILGTLLTVPEATRGLTATDLLEAVERRSTAFDGRRHIISRLTTVHAADPAIVPHYRKRLEAGNRAALEDIARSNIWDASFAEPVLVAFEKNTDAYGDAADILHRRWDRKFVPRLVELLTIDAEQHRGALTLLARHRDDWHGDRKIVASLSDAVREAYPVVDKSTRDIPDDGLESWAGSVRFWALTGDSKVVQKLTPALADRRRFRDPEPAVPGGGLGFGPHGQAVDHEPERVCDAAMNAIWVALDGPAAAERRRGILVTYEKRIVTNEKVLMWRDLQILGLHARLYARIILPQW